jgi:hypothetical protein
MNIGLSYPSSIESSVRKAQSSPMNEKPSRRSSFATVLVLPVPPAAGSAIPWPR